MSDAAADTAARRAAAAATPADAAAAATPADAAASLAALPPAARHAALLAAAVVDPARPPPLTDRAALEASHRFLRTPADDDAAARSGGAWLADAARRYYDLLHREYCVVDLSRARDASGEGGSGPIGLRWRTAAEVRAGKGQLACGARGCGETRGLASFELNFRYVEAGERKAALVKCRVCPPHAADMAAAGGGARRDTRRRHRSRSQERHRSPNDRRRRRNASRSPSEGRGRRGERRHRSRSPGEARRGARQSREARAPPPPGRAQASDMFDGLFD